MVAGTLQPGSCCLCACGCIAVYLPDFNVALFHLAVIWLAIGSAFVLCDLQINRSWRGEVWYRRHSIVPCRRLLLSLQITVCVASYFAWCFFSYVCYTEKATTARHRPERQHNARSNCRKQCGPNETIPYSNPTPLRKRQNTPTNGHTPRRMKPTHTLVTYTRMRPHAPSHQAGDHPVPAHTERHNPPKLRTQRQSGLSPRAASSQGQRHRCRSIRKQSV